MAEKKKPVKAAKPAAKPAVKVEEKLVEKPVEKAVTKPGMSKLRKALIIVDSAYVAILITTLVINFAVPKVSGGVGILLLGLLLSLFITVVVLSAVMLKKEKDKKLFPLISLIASCVLFVGAILAILL